MDIYEYQAKHLFKTNNIPTPDGFVITDINQIDNKIKTLNGDKFVVKAQIKAGGRGVAGGVKIAKDIKNTKQIAKELLGTNLITKQTCKEGEEVKSIYIEECINIDKQYYFCITIDRALDSHSIIASYEGGMDIEEVAKNAPQKIIKLPLDPFKGLCENTKTKLINFLNIKKENTNSFIKTIQNCYNFYMQNDASLLEINPLVKTTIQKDSNTKSDFVALDGKISFDNNALFKHSHINELDELSEDEQYCKTHRLAYIALDGEIGCMVNGAGLAMATMDEIKNANANPANFLDVGGGAKEDAIIKGFEFIVKNKKVKSIFVNIFGGIVRCDIIAKAIIKAVDIKKISLPIIVRLDGTNSKEGMALLKKSNLSNIINANSLEDGAIKAIKASKA
jgi:succinyl-CoA synthetase beta subunit